MENTSDHHPIRMVFKFEHKAYKNESKNVQKIERRIKWEKVDKDIYGNGPNKYRTIQNQLANSELVNIRCGSLKNMSNDEERSYCKLVR